MATIDGARALGLDQDIGSLEPGKAADLVALDLRDPDRQPVYHPASLLVYAAGRSDVRHVWVAGRQLVRDGVALTLDREAILAQARTGGSGSGRRIGGGGEAPSVRCAERYRLFRKTPDIRDNSIALLGYTAART